MNLDGYTKEQIQFNMLWVNTFPFIVFFIFAIIFGVPFYFIWPEIFNTAFSFNEMPGLQARIVNMVIILIPLIIGVYDSGKPHIFTEK